MNNNLLKIFTAVFCASTLVGIFWTENYDLIGLLIGFQTGIINVEWSFKDARKAMGRDQRAAVKTYYKSLFFRLVMITSVFAVVAKFQPKWLFYIAIGMIVGIVIPIIFLRQQLRYRKGGEK